MIDEDRTLQLFGYYSTDLKPNSGKKIVSVCDGCGKYRISLKNDYRDLCRSCCQIDKQFSDEHKQKLSNSQTGKNNNMHGVHRYGEDAPNYGHKHSDETKKLMSKSRKNKNLGDKNPFYGKKHSLKSKIKSSCTKQDINIENFDGFLTEIPYCPKFNESCRESNRDKYNRECFICGKDEEDNGKRLSVHHIDMNKNQGCDSEWKLIPVCATCHNKLHSKLWRSRIEYLIGCD